MAAHLRTATMSILAATIAVTSFLSGCSTGGTGVATNADGTNATVVRVIDGDTVDLRVGGRTERVRLIGIDTPETKRPNTPVQCYGPEASAYTAALLPENTAVRLERDLEPRDAYDRLLGYVFLADGTFVNAEIIRSGHARTLTIEPNTSYSAELARAADEARRAGAGLWSACNG